MRCRQALLATSLDQAAAFLHSSSSWRNLGAALTSSNVAALWPPALPGAAVCPPSLAGSCAGRGASGSRAGRLARASAGVRLPPLLGQLPAWHPGAGTIAARDGHHQARSCRRAAAVAASPLQPDVSRYVSHSAQRQAAFPPATQAVRRLRQWWPGQLPAACQHTAAILASLPACAIT